jgi:EAL domain-containing protein (putative c-di-GMP-specific phosphodiesterase class I)
MNYNLYFDMSAALITLVILIAAEISKWIPTYKNRSYRLIVQGVFFTALCDFGTCYLENAAMQGRSWYIPAKYCLDTGYHISHVLTGLFFALFTLSIINLEIETTKRRIQLFAPVVITQILLVLNLFFPVIFSYDASGTYQRMPLIILIYIFGFYYLGMSVVVLIRYRKSVEARVIAIMAAYAAMAVTGILIQTFYPAFMIGEFFNALALVLMYMNIETADEIKDDKYQIMTRKAYLSQITALVGNGVPFQSVFLHINDLHETALHGDEFTHSALMREIISYLKQFKKDAWIGLWNENCLVLDVHSGCAKAEEIMRAIEERFHEPWNIGESFQTPGMTEWMVRYPQDVQSVDELARKTEMLNDIRLHRHRGLIHLPDISFEELGYSRHMMELAVEAVRKHTAEVRYEPVYDVRRDEIISARSVIFFPDDKGNLVSGNTFINPAGFEDSLAVFDEYSFNDAAQNKDLLMKQSTLLEVSTRLTGALILKPNFVERLKRISERFGADHTEMMLRISDGTYAQLEEEQIEALRRMKQDGWLFAIDDFGMGQSVLSRLSDSEISYLIMHRNVTNTILSSEQGRKFGRGLIHAIHGMKKTITLTGIQTAEQAKQAIEMGADYICGPFLTEPLPPLEFRSWMKARENHVLQ